MTAMLVSDPPRRPELSQPLVLLIHADWLATSLERALTESGYRVERTADGLEALSRFAALEPHFVLVESDLPGLSGLEVARRLRATSDVPIVMLSALAGVEERIAGLDAGADDYLTKPFAVEELLARLRAVQRGRLLGAASAAAHARHGMLAYADLRLDLDRRQAFRGDRALELRNKAFELLACFMRHPERVLSRHDLLGEVWGYEFLGDSNVIEVTVSSIRQTLETAGEPRLIHTIRPVGYILHARSNTHPAP
jgi:two-component system response regulator MprA